MLTRKQNYNTTFYQFSERNNFVHDQRGFSHFLISEASTFLKSKTLSTGQKEITDPRVLLSKKVTKIDYSSTDHVTVYPDKGECVEAEHALVTFSLGVLQGDVVDFVPALPDV